jgi:hypothetical protein
MKIVIRIIFIIELNFLNELADNAFVGNEYGNLLKLS